MSKFPPPPKYCAAACPGIHDVAVALESRLPGAQQPAEMPHSTIAKKWTEEATAQFFFDELPAIATNFVGNLEGDREGHWASRWVRDEISLFGGDPQKVRSRAAQ